MRPSKSLKVLHVTPSFYPALVYGGPTYSVYGLCQSLVRQKCQVRVLTTDANGPDSVLNVKTNEDVEVSMELFVRYCHRIGDVSVSPALLRLLISRVRWAHVVHLMAVYSFPTIPTLLACRIVGRPVVWSPRGMLQRWEGTSRRELKAMWEKVCVLVSPKNLVLHATSDEEARASEHRLPGIQTVVVRNGVEIPETILPRKGRVGFQVTYLGRLHPIKGIENLLSAYRIVNEGVNTGWSLVIAGSGEAEYTGSIRDHIRKLGLSEHVKLIGDVTDNAKRKLFENSDVVVLPSHSENFGIVVAEALAHGVPVIASRGTPWKRVEEIGCGFWVENDPDSLAAALMRIRTMPLCEMGRKGREWIEREFTWDAIAAEMVQVYQNLIEATLSDRRR